MRNRFLILAVTFAAVTMFFASCGDSTAKKTGNENVSEETIKSSSSLTGTVWKGYYDDGDISIMSESERKTYEQDDGADGLELRFIGDHIVKFLDGNYRDGVFVADDGSYSYEYNYNAPRGTATCSGGDCFGNFQFIVDNNVMIVYFTEENGDTDTWTLIQVK